MENIKVFNDSEFGQVRMVKIDGKPYAIGIDVAKILDYARPNEAISAHCPGTVSYRIGVQTGIKVDGSPAIQIIETKAIPEGDIYRLIIKAADQSRNPEIRAKAERFERWIFDEVIPSIHKTGFYGKPESAAAITAEARLIKEKTQAARAIFDTATQLKEIVPKEYLMQLVDTGTNLITGQALQRNRIGEETNQGFLKGVYFLVDKLRYLEEQGIPVNKEWILSETEKFYDGNERNPSTYAIIHYTAENYEMLKQKRLLM